MPKPDEKPEDGGLDITLWVVASALLVVLVLAIAIRKWGKRCINRGKGTF